MAINLEKITLEKQGDSHKIDLSKSTNTKELVINLNWSQDAPKKGFFAKIFAAPPVDLDLGCFFELQDGQKTVIDGLQFSQGQGGPRDRFTRQGCYTAKPWIWHTGDDRSGSGSGENILVNPAGIKDIKRMTIYCFIYEGVARWTDTNAVVTVKIPDNPDVVVEMGKQSGSQNFCAIVELTFDSGNSITVKKLVSFHNNHGECDRKYGWGMKWSSGSK